MTTMTTTRMTTTTATSNNDKTITNNDEEDDEETAVLHSNMHQLLIGLQVLLSVLVSQTLTNRCTSHV